jgi:hypothetical protein
MRPRVCVRGARGWRAWAGYGLLSVFLVSCGLAFKRGFAGGFIRGFGGGYEKEFKVPFLRMATESCTRGALTRGALEATARPLCAC